MITQYIILLFRVRMTILMAERPHAHTKFKLQGMKQKKFQQTLTVNYFKGIIEVLLYSNDYNHIVFLKPLRLPPQVNWV